MKQNNKTAPVQLVGQKVDTFRVFKTLFSAHDGLCYRLSKGYANWCEDVFWKKFSLENGLRGFDCVLVFKRGLGSFIVAIFAV